MDSISEHENDYSALAAVLIIVLTLMAALTGTLFAVTRYPAMLPGLASSLLGAEPKAYWYLSRATALTAFFLLWISMAMGISITNRLAKVWPGGPTAFELHEFFSLLGIAFALFHGAILMGDHYIHYGLTQVLVPFTSQQYKPFWVGLGQLSFYIWGFVVLSFYLRKRINTRNWRLIHYATYLVFVLALVHSIVSGTDSGVSWTNIIYWTSFATLFFLLVYRILVSASGRQKRPATTGS
jgi:predicted ferric reductase